MARIEITCTDDLKASMEHYAKEKGLSLASYIKSAVVKQMKKDEKENV